jgi:hypothetical protein
MMNFEPFFMILEHFEVGNFKKKMKKNFFFPKKKKNFF